MASVFEGKPDWYREYAKTVAAYAASQDRVPAGGMYMTKPSRTAEHMRECEVADVHYLNEEVDWEYTVDSFDSNARSHFVNLSVKLSCVCGAVKEEEVGCQSTIDEAVESMLYVP